MSNILLNILFIFVIIVSLSVGTEQNICGGVYLNDYGEIVTPNYPDSYPHHMVCKWNISVAQNHSILLEFKDFYTDPKDYLNVYDVISGKLFLRGRYSGLNHPDHLISIQNHLFLNLSTTSARKGFRLLYEKINRCGGAHENLSHTISSPGYPKRYYENSSCFWTITCPENRTINVKFLDLHLEDDHAYLEILDISSNQLANVTGTKIPNILLTNSNKLFMNFKSDGSRNAKGMRGFNISYTTLMVGTDLPFIISTTNAIITTHKNQTIDNIIYNSVNEYSVIDYDIHRKKVLLFDPQSYQLIVNNFDESTTINTRPDAIAYDWVHCLIYWMDSQMKTINVMDSNDIKSNFYSICEIKGGNQRDLVLNVDKWQLIWSQIGSEPKLWHINSDGSNQKVLYSSLRQAFHLTIDYETKRYYFIDISIFLLVSIDFSGSKEINFIVSSSLFDSVISMTVLNNNLYLVNNEIIYRIPELSSRIKRAEILYNSDRHESTQNDYFYDFKSIDIKRPEIFGFKIVDQLLQPNVTNRCLHSKCDGLCLPTAQSYRCLMNLVTSSPVIMKSSTSSNTLAIFNTVAIVILVAILIFLYFSVKQMIIKFENRIFQVLVPTVSFRKSSESTHEYENHDYEEPVFKQAKNGNSIVPTPK